MNAFPMIAQGMRLQKQSDRYYDGGFIWEYFGYYACRDCKHEVVARDNLYVFDCGWCDKKAIAPVWILPQEDGEVESETAAIFGYVYADA